MTKCAPKLQPLLSPDQIQQMHRAALEILETVGIKVEHPRLIQMLTAQNDVTIEDNWVRLQPDVVDRYVNEQRQRARLFSHPETSEIHCSAGGYASYTVDMETDEVRPITTNDLIQYTKLIHAMNDAGYPISGSCPGFPQDVPPPLRPLAQYKIGAEYSKFGGNADIPSIPIAEYIREMQQVMGRLLRSSQPSASFSLPLYIVSPLRLQGDSLERVLHFWDELSSISVSSMPMIGVSLPIFFPDAFVLAMAEVMGGYTILRLMGAANVSFSVNAHPFDMKYTTLTFASPEHNLCDLTQMEINRFYGISHPGSRSLRTMAKRPGIQAAAEKSASAVIGALAGSRSFSSGGVMALDELFSPEQLVIDCEIIAYVKRFIEGYEFSRLRLGIQDIREMSLCGNFLEHDSTLKHYRDTYWMPQLFEHTMLRQWFEIGEPDLRRHAQAIVHEMIQKYDYRLDEAKQRQLNKIYEHAKCKLKLHPKIPPHLTSSIEFPIANADTLHTQLPGKIIGEFTSPLNFAPEFPFMFNYLIETEAHISIFDTKGQEIQNIDFATEGVSIGKHQMFELKKGEYTVKEDFMVTATPDSVFLEGQLLESKMSFDWNFTASDNGIYDFYIAQRMLDTELIGG